MGRFTPKRKSFVCAVPVFTDKSDELTGMSQCTEERKYDLFSLIIPVENSVRYVFTVLAMKLKPCS